MVSSHAHSPPSLSRCQTDPPEPARFDHGRDDFGKHEREQASNNDKHRVCCGSVARRSRTGGIREERVQPSRGRFVLGSAPRWLITAGLSLAPALHQAVTRTAWILPPDQSGCIYPRPIDPTWSGPLLLVPGLRGRSRAKHSPPSPTPLNASHRTRTNSRGSITGERKAGFAGCESVEKDTQNKNNIKKEGKALQATGLHKKSRGGGWREGKGGGGDPTYSEAKRTKQRRT